MISKELGATGVFIPEIGIGTWEYHAGAHPLRQGLETGALFVDTAESYGTEEVVGEALVGIRDKVFLATKISPEHFRRDLLIRSAEACLRRLRVDNVDLLQLHQPNPSIPIEEPIGALTALVDAGKVRFIGVSNFSLQQLREAQAASAKYPIVSNQLRYNIIDRTIEKDLLPYCQANRITIIAYSPLGRGLDRIRDCDPQQTIARMMKETGRTASQIVLNWCLCKEGIVVIPKGNSMSHILENCGASDWRLSEKELKLLDGSIRFRERTAFDGMVRRYMPSSMRTVALALLKYMPSSLRRRIT